VKRRRARRGSWAGVAAGAAALLLAASVWAQGSGVLVGTVRDAATKKPLRDVVVSVTSPSLQGEQTVVTDAAGQYRVPNLPPGEYTVRLEGDAYRPYARSGVGLRTDATLRVNAELLPEGLHAEEVTVLGVAPTVDVGSTTTGVSLNQDFISRIALSAPSSKGAASRSFESLAEVAPGAAADTYGVSISGTTSPENNYVIDGVSVNNPGFGILGAPLSSEFIKEINVITGGYMPEYGRAEGGTLNVVTKSGGNEFHGSVFASITPGIFEGSRTQVESAASTISTTVKLSSLRDFGVEIGGPIVRDKLWFYAGVTPGFATYSLDRQLNSLKNGVQNPIPGTDTGYLATSGGFTYIGKLTWALGQDDTLSISVFGTPTTSGGNGTFGINPTTGQVEILTNGTPQPISKGILNGSFSALAHEYVSNATDTVLKWQHAADNKRTLFDATVGWHHENEAIRASDGSKLGDTTGLASVSQIYWQRNSPGPHSINDFDASNGTRAACDPAGTMNATLCPVDTYYTGGPGYLRETTLDRWQARGVLTRLFSGLGHHVAKAGVDVEAMRYEASRGYSGSRLYDESTDGTQFSEYRTYGFLVGPDQADVVGAFHAVSSSYTMGGYLQDSWSFLDRVTINVGVRYDAQLLFGSDGNLAVALPNEVSPRVGLIWDPTQSGRAKIFASYARFYEDMPLDAIDRSIPGERQITATHQGSPSGPLVNQNAPAEPNQQWGTVGADKDPVDPNLQAQSSDEFIVGGEYEIFENARVGAQWTHRYQNRIIEDMSRDEAETYFIGNPGYGIAKDFPKPVRDYDAGTFFFQKAFSDLWLAQASYTVSYLRGNWAGLFHPETGQLDPNINSDFDLLSLLANRSGPLPGDHTHSIKIYLAKDFVFSGGAFDAGLSFKSMSGGPTTYFGAHPLYGADQVYILPRGSGERLPWAHEFDLHLGGRVNLAKESSLGLSVDIFNLFNFQAATSTDQTYTLDTVAPIVNGTVSQLSQLRNADGTKFNPKDVNPNFGNPIAYQPPLQVRFGAKVTF
jgi:Carboxypeptidase regulatory-like domain/TonB dependent receptor